MIKATRIRFKILALIFVTVVINYIDRSNISLAAPLFSKDLKLSSVQLGLIFSAFGWTYTLLQIPGGWLADVVGPRLLYFITIGLWSVTTLAQAGARNFGSLIGLRLGIGIFEAPAFPINNRIATTWFPTHERATAIGTYTSGQFAGLAFLTPLLVAIQQAWGWGSVFTVTGIVGVIWSIIWYWLYRDPTESRQTNNAELDYIKEGGGIVDWGKGNPKGKNRNFGNIKHVIVHRRLWSIYIGHFCVTSTTWFFLTWFPTYLVKYRHIAFIKAGFFSSLPFLAAFVGVLISGYLSDLLIRHEVSIGIARKTPVILGLLLSAGIIGANYVQGEGLIVLFMTIAFLGNGLSSIGWVFVSELAPVNLVGLTSGVYNFLGMLSSIITPITIGFLIKGGNFSPALVFMSILALIGALCYILLNVNRVEIHDQLGSSVSM